MKNYFENISGTGVLATCSGDGEPNAAIYARPYVIDEKTLAFSMLERQSYANLQSNPKACYLFMEKGEGYNGKRIYLTMSGHETDADRIRELKKQHGKIFSAEQMNKHLVYFTITKIRPLVGDGTEAK